MKHVLIGWAWGLFFVLAVIGILSALFPRIKDSREQD